MNAVERLHISLQRNLYTCFRGNTHSSRPLDGRPLKLITRVQLPRNAPQDQHLCHVWRGLNTFARVSGQDEENFTFTDLGCPVTVHISVVVMHFESEQRRKHGKRHFVLLSRVLFTMELNQCQPALVDWRRRTI